MAGVLQAFWVCWVDCFLSSSPNRPLSGIIILGFIGLKRLANLKLGMLLFIEDIGRLILVLFHHYISLGPALDLSRCSV